ncbi:hypothetical protein [Thiomicrospira microaerophila]|uniref:hypothetical protein n=1 Tax=Thiomicrospira microaerophila TaxID=406020 RepID=UPI0005CAEEDD|nr:hypothetical protein [Thiomicrospira microaerophila]
MKARFNLKKMSAVCCAALPMMAFAGSPMNVDDAALLDAKHCHIEAWSDQYNKASNLWIAPACNLNGRWELGFALGREMYSGDSDTNHFGFNAKTLLLEQADWAVALGLSAAFTDQIKHDQAVYSLVAPITFNLLDGGLDLHLNLGVASDQIADKNFGLWGIGFENHFSDQARGYIELFGNTASNDHESRGYQLGGVFMVTDKLQLDISYGNSLIDADKYTDYVRFGLVYETSSWLK